MNGEINGAMALVLVMLALLAAMVLSSVKGCRWLAAKLEARGFYLENTRAEADRFRAMADQRCADRMREYDPPPEPSDGWPPIKGPMPKAPKPPMSRADRVAAAKSFFERVVASQGQNPQAEVRPLDQVD